MCDISQLEEKGTTDVINEMIVSGRLVTFGASGTITLATRVFFVKSTPMTNDVSV